MTERFWTKDLCIASAAPFTTRTAWQKACAGAYDAASREGWREDCCAHMPVKKQPNGYWTLERCQEQALRFKTVREWADNSGSSFVTAVRNKWVPLCDSHMDRVRVHRGTWDFDACYASAQTFSYRSDWMRGSPSAYDTARDNGWVDACCAHMTSKSQWDTPSNVLYALHIDSPVGAFIKIGRAVDMQVRVMRYKLHQACTVTALHVHECGDTHATHRAESRLKSLLRAHKLPNNTCKAVMDNGFSECYSTMCLPILNSSMTTALCHISDT
jgi:hypothetical protein